MQNRYASARLMKSPSSSFETPPQQPEERLSSGQLKQLRSDFEDFQSGHHMPAREAIAKLRARYAL